MNDQLNAFKNISLEEKDRMFSCFGVRRKRYEAGETIITYSGKLNTVCIMLRGKAGGFWIDDDGNSAMLELIQEGDVFGDVFMMPVGQMEYYVEATSACEVMFIGYDKVIHPCKNLCCHHSQLINNLYELTAKRLQQLALRINVLTQKSIRRKLAAYLIYEKNLAGSMNFRLSVSLTGLADYICSDRSSLTRELAAMKQEGYLDWQGREFRLYEQINNIL
ncbi:MAG: Crp/Fnr family transcriptional regulator [Ruminococcaceae bacterium]|nr:Crp/Fnr family transcriptional regulator [Oscillospiraceae bacterium]